MSVLEVNGDMTTPPIDHKAFFNGEHPCDKNGNKLRHIEHTSNRQQLCENLVSDHSFSSKPKEGYKDYYHKMTTYADMISRHARAIEPSATAQTYVVIEPDNRESVFNYSDSASTRAGITAITDKLALKKVAIIGLGGTGSYVLDLIAKTPIWEIHLFDGDDFLQHNAFKCPGAVALDRIRERIPKVAFFADEYSLMRKNIIPHPVYLDENNIDLLDGMSFVFLCIDSGKAKRPIVEKLESEGIPFVDVGMGVNIAEDKLVGVVRVTANTPEKHDHFRSHVGFTDSGNDNAYSTNIQIADLNALNATLAVIKWKKMFGFYADFDNEHSSNYTIDGNTIANTETTS